MVQQELSASLLLNAVKEIGPARFRALVKQFGSARAAVEAGVPAWREAPLFDSETLKRIEADWDKSRAGAEKDLRLAEKFHTRIYLLQEGPYPRLLREICHPPPVLYARGEDLAVERPAIALVGSRRCSLYGEKTARVLADDLTAAGVTTVSGLARGIDTHVHQATLEAEGKTWAVVGCGLSQVYPPENRKLAEAVKENGAVISEFPMDTLPFPANFPRRNRVIAGLSLGTVVVEGGERSGSLITARLAAEEGRDVFAVPGSVNSPLSAAPHRLLQMGAIMVQSAADILREIGLTTDSKGKAGLEPVGPVPETYRPVLALLGTDPVPKETLAERLNTPIPALSSLLLEMELRGLVRSMPGGSVTKT